MFGRNVIRKIDPHVDSLAVHSVFATIQGEGPFAGRAAIFLRLAGCSLACSWCDTEFEHGERRVPIVALADELEQKLTQHRDKFCVITGGEPMRQNLVPLLTELTTRQWEVQIETAGIHWNEGLDDWLETHIVCSPKTPKIHPILEVKCEAFKYIIDAKEEFSPSDGLPLRAVSQRGAPQGGLLFRPRNMKRPIYVQPLDSDDDDENECNTQRCITLTMNYGYRLSLQQHKILNLP